MGVIAIHGRSIQGLLDRPVELTRHPTQVLQHQSLDLLKHPGRISWHGVDATRWLDRHAYSEVGVTLTRPHGRTVQLSGKIRQPIVIFTKL